MRAGLSRWAWAVGSATLVGAAMVGCSGDDASAPAATAPVAASAPPAPKGDVVETAAAATVGEPPAATPGDAPNAADATAQSASADYEPPFPDRVDLFLAPKRHGAAATAQNGAENPVELMGFIRVDRPRALLAINGEVAPMAEGESQYGIEVISVNPPQVVLQRGRQRWTATLE